MNDEHINHPADATTDEEQLQARLARTRLPPELLAWALEQFSEEEFLQELEKVKQTGGVSIDDLLEEDPQPASTDSEHPER